MLTFPGSMMSVRLMPRESISESSRVARVSFKGYISGPINGPRETESRVLHSTFCPSIFMRATFWKVPLPTPTSLAVFNMPCPAASCSRIFASISGLIFGPLTQSEGTSAARR